jgi:FkbH-like protein
MERVPFSWLTALPTIRKLLEQNPNDGISGLRRTARSQSADGFEIELIGRLLRDVSPSEVTALPVYRLAVLASYTSEPIANAARVALLREGYLADVYEAPFGSHQQEILSASSTFYGFQPDAVLLAVSPDDDVPAVPLTADGVEAWLDRQTQSWCALWDALGARLQRPVLQHVYELPEEEFLGVAERRAAWTASRLVDALNVRLVSEAPGFVRWIDVDRLAARVGRQNWRDARLYHHGRFGFSSRFLSQYSHLLAAALRSATAKVKKALIVDVDNTLWGGVIGDDKLDGIRLGPGTAEGAAFEAFCRYVKALGDRGVILGICSKNDAANVVEVFETHRHMPLKLSDFAAVVCNWNDKAENLAQIARDINIDLSAMVFADDNPVECEWVRSALPEVHTILMDGDPALFVRKLDHLHLFDADTFSDDDLKRSGSYQARAKVAAIQGATSDLASFLASLGMTAEFRAAGPGDLPRLAQMELKTNQFNLSTRRLAVEQLKAMATATDCLVAVVSLSDRFADHGLVSYVAAHVAGETLHITDWLMSCRVFSRTLELFVFNHLARHARERNLRTIQAVFRPTDKNKVMEGLFERVGFSCAGSPPEGPWLYDVAEDRAPVESLIADRSFVEGEGAKS